MVLVRVLRAHAHAHAGVVYCLRHRLPLPPPFIVLGSVYRYRLFLPIPRALARGARDHARRAYDAAAALPDVCCCVVMMRTYTINRT